MKENKSTYKPNCCNKCFDEGVSQLSYGGCKNARCECHVQLATQSTPMTQDIKERFEKQLEITFGLDKLHPAQYGQFWKFFTSELSLQRKELVEKLEEILKETNTAEFMEETMDVESYQQAIRDAIKAIQDEKT